MCAARPSRAGLGSRTAPRILPHPLATQDKALIGKVSGANAPEVVSMVADNIPEVPEE